MNHEPKWVRLSATDNDVFVQTSKFLAAGSRLGVRELEEIWDKLTIQEKLGLCCVYHSKPVLKREDERVLNFMMRNGEEVVWSSMASVLVRHTERRHIIAFITDRITNQTPPLANFYHTAELLGESALVPLLLERCREYERVNVGPNITDRAFCVDYLGCVAALWRLTRSPEYEKTIRDYLGAKDQLVRDCAKNLLRRSGGPGL